VLKSGLLNSATERAEVSLVANALRVGGSHIGSNPNSLAFDLLGRLLVYYDRRPPTSSSSTSSFHLSSVGDESPTGGDPAIVSLSAPSSPEAVVDGSSAADGVGRKPGASSHPVFDDISDSRSPAVTRHDRIMRGSGAEPGIRSLLQQCDLRSPSDSALLPILPCFDPPTAEMLCVLEGHAAVVSDMAFLPAAAASGNRLQSALSTAEDVDELISIAADGTVCVTVVFESY
jgi:hypothetical protein